MKRKMRVEHGCEVFLLVVTDEAGSQQIADAFALIYPICDAVIRNRRERLLANVRFCLNMLKPGERAAGQSLINQSKNQI